MEYILEQPDVCLLFARAEHKQAALGMIQDVLRYMEKKKGAADDEENHMSVLLESSSSLFTASIQWLQEIEGMDVDVPDQETHCHLFSCRTLQDALFMMEASTRYLTIISQHDVQLTALFEAATYLFKVALGTDTDEDDD